MTETERLYHGTRAGFGAGGVLFPGATPGVDRDNHGLGRSEWVYVTPDLDLAKDYAEAASGRGRPKVLEVVPCGPLEVDDSTVGGEAQEAYRCEWAWVVRRVWIAPRAVSVSGHEAGRPTR
jgi:hypothetical protein